MMSTGETLIPVGEDRPTLDPRRLHRKLTDAVSEIGLERDPVEILGKLLDSLVSDPVIPVIGGRIWVCQKHEYRLVRQVGGRKEIPKDYSISIDEGIIRRVNDHGVIFVKKSDPGYNPKLEEDLGVQDYAAITFGEEGRFLLSLDVTSTSFEDREEILSFLAILRFVINQRIEKDHFEWIIREARDVQTSILPKEIPRFRDYDLFGLSLPARENVGGDFFDLIPIEGDNLGVVVADSSGHGLPSALMARDVRTALHMGIASELKATRLMARINRLVCNQAPSDRFISLFYGEIDVLDQMIYSSAGHPVVLFSGRDTKRLKAGGPVLGIHPEARYTRGMCALASGDLLCLYTDGLSEAHNPQGELFGDDRIVELLSSSRGRPAREIVNRVFDVVHRFTQGSQEDDQTLLVIQRK